MPSHRPTRRQPGGRSVAPPPESLARALLLAAGLVAGVRDGRTLSDGLDQLRQRESTLSASQRGAVQDLAYGTLRDYGLDSSLLDPLLRGETPDPIYSLLLVAIHRLRARPESAHTIVDQCVLAASTIFSGKLRGLVNGVLRNYLRRSDELARTADALSVARYRHPDWWVARLKHAYPNDFANILEAGNQHPPMALRVNRRRATVAQVLEALAAKDIEARTAPDFDDAILLDRPLPVSRIPGFEAGHCSVQDPAAQRAAALLDLADGQRVLDACAAPGGKSAHILEYADVALTAVDVSPQRMHRVDDNLRRLGLSAKLIVADCREVQDWWDGHHFDRILADLPCSASGVVRRNPDIKWLRRDEDIDGFSRQQAEMLDRLWHTLAPGGRMLYSTCSVFPEENAVQLERFCERHADAHSMNSQHQSQRQLLPCAQHDGFFYALLEKRQ